MNVCCFELAEQGHVKEKDMFQRESGQVNKDKCFGQNCFVLKLFNEVHVHWFGGNTAVVVRINIA